MYLLSITTCYTIPVVRYWLPHRWYVRFSSRSTTVQPACYLSTACCTVCHLSLHAVHFATCCRTLYSCRILYSLLFVAAAVQFAIWCHTPFSYCVYCRMPYCYLLPHAVQFVICDCILEIRTFTHILYLEKY